MSLAIALKNAKRKPKGNYSIATFFQAKGKSPELPKPVNLFV